LHLERTLDWLLVLEPDAAPALQIAALIHDIERAIPLAEGEAAPDSMSPEYNDWHQRRSAAGARRWLSEQHASPELIAEVAALVRVHEDGGSPDADLLQAADSLAFLEVQTDLFAGFVADGRLARADAERKVRWMYERVAVPHARELAGPLLEDALARLAAGHESDEPERSR
jgi:hypothetical protein